MDDFDNTPIQLWAAMAEAIKKIGNQELQRKKSDVRNLAMKINFFVCFLPCARGGQLLFHDCFLCTTVSACVNVRFEEYEQRNVNNKIHTILYIMYFFCSGGQKATKVFNRLGTCVVSRDFFSKTNSPILSIAPF